MSTFIGRPDVPLPGEADWACTPGRRPAAPPAISAPRQAGTKSRRFMAGV
jgi:hypothetical protein